MADARDVHVWDKHALEDHQTAKPYPRAEAIEAMLELTENIKLVVDMGCGSGLWRLCFKDFDYIGLDQSPEMIKTAHTRGNYGLTKDTRFRQTNLRNKPLAQILETSGGKYPDLIWFSAVLQHNRHEPDKREILENVAQALKPGKYLMFTENTFCEENPMIPGTSFVEGKNDGNSYTRNQWKEVVESHGFKLLMNEPFNFYLFQKI